MLTVSPPSLSFGVPITWLKIPSVLMFRNVLVGNDSEDVAKFWDTTVSGRLRRQFAFARIRLPVFHEVRLT